jgi:hypothetical protein
MVKLGLGHSALDMLLSVKQNQVFDTSMAILIHKPYRLLLFDPILASATLWRAYMLHLAL